MGRKNRRKSHVRVSLDCGDITELPRAEIEIILRGAENFIGSGGRTSLVKLLRGSQAKDMNDLIRANPIYGVWADQHQTWVAQRVDWCIENGYLEIQKHDGFPLLVYSQHGLIIECGLVAAEFSDQVVTKPEVFFSELERIPLPTLFALLDHIADLDDDRHRPFLEAWKKTATKRLKSRISAVMAERDDTGTRRRYVFETVWIDESLGLEVLHVVERAKRSHQLYSGEIRWIGEEHSGLPDYDIFHQLLAGKPVCFVSKDRAFHNAILDGGGSSFYCSMEMGDDFLNPERLRGIEPKGILAHLGEGPMDTLPIPPRPREKEKESPIEMPPWLFPETPSQQKKMRTKRRRIRNYFGGTDRIEKCTIALSARPMSGGQMLVGMRLRILPQFANGLKALDASENYLAVPEDLAAFAFAPIAVILFQLGLRDIPIEIHYDPTRLSPPSDGEPGALWDFLENLIFEFPNRVEFHPGSAKNRHLNRLNQKLDNLCNEKTNEIVPADLRPMLDARRDLPPRTPSHDIPF